MTEAIAIVGMACEYPDASDPDALWTNVLAQHRSFRRIPEQRLSLRDYLDVDGEGGDRISAANAALVADWEFDRVGHRVSGRTFRSTDTTHWLALDVAERALADVAVDYRRWTRPSQVGVVVGNTLTGEFSRSQVLRLRWPYVRRTVEAALAGRGWDRDERGSFLARLEEDFKAPFEPVGEDSLAGGLSNVIAGRICNQLDLGGGGYTVDGACSSSLLAITQAAESLVRGDLDLAVAGGVDLSLDPFELVGFSRTSALATDLMRVYDARSRGFWPGEGCGFVVLSRLEDARRAGVPVHAVLRGWGISSDGAGGTTRPEQDGQRLALSRAYARAGFSIASVSYFEGHGTGTAVGDAVEIGAVDSARRDDGAQGRAALGSIKANIGHTKAAAGAAGLIKAAVAVRQQVLPPTTGCVQPHPRLKEAGCSIEVLTEPRAWPDGMPVRAGVSSMGFGGINTHVVLEADDRTGRRRPQHDPVLGTTAQDAELLVAAAATPAELVEDLRSLASALEPLSFAELRQVAIRTLATPPTGTWRASVVADSPAAAAERLRAVGDLLDVEHPPTSHVDTARGTAVARAGDPTIGLLFPGQAAPTRLDAGALGRRLPGTAEGTAPEQVVWHDRAETQVAQPAIIGSAVTGLRALARLGVDGSWALGHSVGELAALHWAGALAEETVLDLAHQRGAIMAAHCLEAGGMAEIAADRATCERLAAGLPVAVAAQNAARRTVVAGATDAVAAVLERAAARGIGATSLPVSHAFHSPLVGPAVAPFVEVLRHTDRARPARPVFSTVTGARLDPEHDLDALLSEQVTGTVRLTDALVAAGAAGADLLVEVGPGTVMTGLAQANVPTPAVALDVGARSVRGLLTVAGTAWTLGAAVDLTVLTTGRVLEEADPLRERRFFSNPCEQAPRVDDEADPIEMADVASTADEPVATEPAPVEPTTDEVVTPADVEAPPVETAAADGPSGSTFDVVRRAVAERAELPVAVVAPEALLLADLGLNSITVGHLVADVSRELGIVVSLPPTEVAAASVSELADLLDRAQEGYETSGGVNAAGVRGWVRALETTWTPLPVPPEAPRLTSWSTLLPPDVDAGLAARVDEVYPAADAPDAERGVVVVAPDERVECGATWLVCALADALDRADRVVLLHDGTSGAVARTAVFEAPAVAVTVAAVGRPTALASAEVLDRVRLVAGDHDRYEELSVDEDGTLRRRGLLPVDLPPGPAPVGVDDVVLVTGGGRGIGAECARELAERTGCALALVGRRRAGEDEELDENLARLEQRGLRHVYLSCDVTDPSAVDAALEEVTARLGPVTGLLHAAGVNRPAALASLSSEEVTATVRAKVGSLAVVLDRLEARSAGPLRLLVGFGSIIARVGMHGEAHYALANEWLTALVEEYGRDHPAARCVSLEWSVWAARGMGDRLDVLDALARQGVHAISLDEGLRAFVAAVEAQPADVGASTWVVAGRYGSPPTVPVRLQDLPLLRFCEDPQVWVPGVELVCDAVLGWDTDPYLAEHTLDGVALLPAVVGLEAMAQVAHALTGRRVVSAQNVRFDTPVRVGPDSTERVRVAGLVIGPDAVELVVRSESTGYTVDHFSAVLHLGHGDAVPAPADAVAVADVDRDVPVELYEDLLFHGPRFQRLAALGEVHARRSTTSVTCRDDAWFSAYLPGTLVLGDPGARDAVLHGAQVTIPHRRFVPTAVEHVDLGMPTTGEVVVLLTERSREGRVLTADAEVRGPDGAVVERWTGIRMHELGELDPPRVPPVLWASLVERRMQEAGLDASVRLGVAGRDETDTALRRAVGDASLEIVHRPDGAPELVGPDGPDPRPVTVTRVLEQTLVAVGAPGGLVALDAEVVDGRTGDLADRLLTSTGRDLVSALRGEDEDEATAATRAWGIAECLRKAGLDALEPVVRTAGDEGASGWSTWRAGPHRVLSGVVPLGPQRLVLTVLTGDRDLHHGAATTSSADLSTTDPRGES